jgi:hypothetical protein
MKHPIVELQKETTMPRETKYFGRGKCKYVITYYMYGVDEHKEFKCPEKQNPRRKNEAMC